MISLFDRHRRRLRRLVKRADKILKEIDRQLAMPEPSRENELDDFRLNTAKEYVVELRACLQSGKLPDKPYRYASMTRMIADHWPHGTSLGDAIADLEADYKII